MTGGELERFVAAQDGGSVYERALHELLRGEKQSHWMWFVFPQLAGLGTSAMAQRYAISSLDEARAYASHPVLAPRLRECCHALLEHHDRTAAAILGSVDAIKLRSSATLFRAAAPSEPVFAQVLNQFFAGQPDPRTLELLGV